MAGSEDRPVPRAGAIDPGEKTEILRELLVVERARLQNALDLEQKRKIVFPETTVIIKDIERLIEALADKPVSVNPAKDGDQGQLEALLEEARGHLPTTTD